MTLDELRTDTSRETLTAEDIKSEIAAMDHRLDADSKEFKAAVVLMAALQVGARIGALAAFTGYQRHVVSNIVHLAKRNDIFTRSGHVAGSAWFEPDGALAFWMDVCCATGMMQRAKAGGR